MAHEYHLRVSKITQSVDANIGEAVAAPDQIDRNNFLYIYVVGYLPSGSRGVFGRYQEVGASSHVDLGIAVPSPDGHRFTITHYYLTEGKSYIIRFADDFSTPSCLGSQVIDVP